MGKEIESAIGQLVVAEGILRRVEATRDAQLARCEFSGIEPAPGVEASRKAAHTGVVIIKNAIHKLKGVR